ncbi:unnamed protein product [Sphagnum jensenii]|uniref:Enoyl reductase (ER) domain-containing protein n=1 Tax=Sphagnum jensenii TaxID=128206 RepID=A0ABP0V8H1_9BRYO
MQHVQQHSQNIVEVKNSCTGIPHDRSRQQQQERLAVVHSSPSDKVYGTGMGALAEKIIAKDSEISLKPTTTTFIQAASLPVVSLTAYQALTQGEAKTGSRVLIVGASGGCGLIGIQMARYMVGPNGKVGGICGTHNLDFVRNMGVCDMVMDYKTPEVLIGNDSPLKTFGEFDLLYDTVSSPKPTDNLNGQSYDIALSKFFTPRTKTVAIHGVSARWLWMLLGWEARNFHLMICSTKRTGVQLQSIASMVDTGAVKPVIDSVYPFAPEGLESAYARLLSRRARGKVVIDIFRGQEV